MDAATHERALGKVVQLTRSSTDLALYWREVNEVLRRVVPHYWSPCWYTLDPSSLLITSHFNDELEEFPQEWLAGEYLGDDLHTLVEVARSSSGISTLHEATDGDPSGTLRWQENIKMGGDQELIAALRTRTGEVWGALGLYREPGSAMFDESEKAFLTAVSPHLAEGARRALVFGEATDPDWPDGPCLLIVDERGELESSTPGAARWLSELPDGDPARGRLPSAVQSVAVTALRLSGESDWADEAATARVRSRAGRWVMLHGAVLAPGGRPRATVIVEPAHPARIYPLLMSAHGLTDREQDVTRLVLRGRSTAQIADELVVSAHTVQQHLKGIFDKTGVRSRRDLVAKVFFTHYQPRFRDNEHRVLDRLPTRGQPAYAQRPAATG